MINLYIVSSIVFWASSFVGLRAASAEFSPIEIAVLRLIVSSIILLFIKISHKTIILKKGHLLRFVLLGFILYINQISLYYGIRTITAGETTLIVSTSQIFQVLLAIFFLNEKLSSRFLIGSLFSFLGVFIIAFQKSIAMSFNLGVVFVIISAVTNAAFFVLQKPLLNNYEPLDVVSYSTWITTFLLLPFGKSAIEKISITSFGRFFSVVYIGIAFVIAHICWSKVLAKIDASKASIFLYTVPVMTIIIGFFWLKEFPSIMSCFGGAVILGGVILSNSKSAATEQAY